ncbi:MAG: hypothetical protein GY829_12695, partial [Gammaproteobacteria bacterium]|nr:hypothetical protein [Gammaproteobacteria bacterium]
MKYNLKQILILLSSITFASVPTLMQAADATWYEIEVIVFEHTNENRLTTEQWDQQISIANIENSKDFLTPDPAKVALKQICLQGELINILETIPVTDVVEEVVIDTNVEGTVDSLAITEDSLTDNFTTETLDTVDDDLLFEEEQPFVILDKELNQLNDINKTLSRRRGYHPLLHVSWRQPVEKKKNSQPIRLYAGYNYSETFNHEGDERVNLATAKPELLEDESSNTFDQSNLEILSKQSYSLEDNKAEAEMPFGMNISTLPIFGDDALQTNANYRQTVKTNINQCQQILQKQINDRHPDVWQLEGNIQLYVGRYLHIDTDLYLRIPGKKELELGALETSLAADRLLNSLQVNS